MTTWHGPDGIEVEVITLNDSPLYKVTQVVNGRQYFVAYCATIKKLARHVDLADLVEVIQLPSRKARAS